MAGRKLRVEWDERDTPEALKAAYRAEQDGRRKERLHALWLLRSDWAATRVATAIGVHYTTVQRWVEWYRLGGLNEVLSRRQGDCGRQPYLDDDERTLLEWELEEGVFDTAADVREWIEVECDVNYTMPGVYSLLKRLN